MQATFRGRVGSVLSGILLAGMGLPVFAQAVGLLYLPQGMGHTYLMSCSKPLAYVAVSPINCESPGCGAGGRAATSGEPLVALLTNSKQPNIRVGVRDMLVEAMRASGCFTLEPPTTNTEYKEADYLVVGALTDVSFKYTTGGYDDTSTVANKVLRMSPQSASMALDLRLVSVNIAQTIFHKNYSAGLSTPPGLPFRPSENNERLGFSSRESVVQGTDLESVSSEVVTQAVNGLVAALKKTRVSALRKAR